MSLILTLSPDRSRQPHPKPRSKLHNVTASPMCSGCVWLQIGVTVGSLAKGGYRMGALITLGRRADKMVMRNASTVHVT